MNAREIIAQAKELNRSSITAWQLLRKKPERWLVKSDFRW